MHSPCSLVCIAVSTLCLLVVLPVSFDLGLTRSMGLNSQTAVVRGAAIRGLEGTFPDKVICRRHYGITWGLPFRPGTDDEHYSYMSFGAKYCSGHMKWILAKVCMTIIIHGFV